MIEKLSREMREELESNILPFWIEKMTDEVHGGFYGRMTGAGELIPQAEKGAILNARILWSFSAAYRVLGRPEYLAAATHAKRYLIDRFYDKEFGGVYWSLDFQGQPLDTKKQIYALGFAIYGLSEYCRATGDEEALSYAIKLFESIEEYSFDPVQGGYFEAFTREWGEIADMRLSDKDQNERKTMNTHLHILEPYANLYRVWKDPRLEKQLRGLIDIFTGKILNRRNGHLELFFDDDWHSKYEIFSYGHDIEASWLLHEAALVLGDGEVLAKVEPRVKFIARAADVGLNPDGSMIHEKNCGRIGDPAALFYGCEMDDDLHWWVQAENVVGHVNLWQHFGDEKALEVAARCWEFIKSHLVDRTGGEWLWSVDRFGHPNLVDDKAGFWKCPYHNTRMCLEVIERAM